MYCIKCGVELGDTEERCPLCKTEVYHPDITRPEAETLYPQNKMPKKSNGRVAVSGAIIIVFLIPFFIMLYSDLQLDGTIDWFGIAGGGVALAYIHLALPFWFKKPNPVIFIPIDFFASTLYLLHVNTITNGNWFLSFAFPLIACLGVISCTAITLLKYLKRGRIYVYGGTTIALGLFILLVEYLLSQSFGLRFFGWSVYPLLTLALFGGLLIYIAANKSARETLERKLFF